MYQCSILFDPRILKEHKITDSSIFFFDLNTRNLALLRNGQIYFQVDHKPEYQENAVIKSFFKGLTNYDAAELKIDIPSKINMKEKV